MKVKTSFAASISRWQVGPSTKDIDVGGSPTNLLARAARAGEVSRSSPLLKRREEKSQLGGSMSRPKITIVGAGNVGGTVAQRMAEKNCYDIVLVDIIEGVLQGKALDMTQAGPICGYDSQVVGANGYDDTADSAVVVITSGVPRKQDESRRIASDEHENRAWSGSGDGEAVTKRDPSLGHESA